MVFPCRCWLAEDEDDGQTTRVLVPGQSLTSRYDSKSGSNSYLFMMCRAILHGRKLSRVESSPSLLGQFAPSD